MNGGRRRDGAGRVRARTPARAGRASAPRVDEVVGTEVESLTPGRESRGRIDAIDATRTSETSGKDAESRTEALGRVVPELFHTPKTRAAAHGALETRI